MSGAAKLISLDGLEGGRFAGRFELMVLGPPLLQYRRYLLLHARLV
jgi:hypothetical protein